MHDTRMTSAKRALVAGWFSFRGGGATAGDLLARDLACEWLYQAGYGYDVAVVAPFDKEMRPKRRGSCTGADGLPVEWLDWRQSDPAAYSLVVFVCGPFAPRAWEREFLARFSGSRLIGLNLSMLSPLDEWNPFDVLFERHSSERACADVVFLAQTKLPPVVGVCLVEDYPKSLVKVANAAVHALIGAREMSIVNIDTRLEKNVTGLRTPGEVEALLARVDVLVTTRLHGMVMALKNGIPALAIDPLGDGRKLLRQGEAIGWPVIFHADDLVPERLSEALDYCLTEAARAKARTCAVHAKGMVKDVRDRFIKAAESAPAFNE